MLNPIIVPRYENPREVGIWRTLVTNTLNAGSVGFGHLVYYVSDYTSLTAAVAAIGSTEATLIIDTDTTVTADLTIPATLSLVCLKGNLISHTTYTITINGNFEAGLFQVFNGTGAVTLTLGPHARPEWFGGGVSASAATNKTAFDKAIVANSTIQLGSGTYSVNYLEKITSTFFVLRGVKNTVLAPQSTGEPFLWISSNLFLIENFKIVSASGVPAVVRIDDPGVDGTIKNIYFTGAADSDIDSVSQFGLTIDKCNWIGQTSYVGVNLQTDWKTPTPDASIATTDINTTTNVITVVTESGDNRTTGQPIRFSTSGVAPAPLRNGAIYYLIRVSATEIKLATSQKNAFAGTAIDLTDVGSGTHAIAAIVVYNNSTTISNCDFTNTSGYHAVRSEGGGTLSVNNTIIESYTGAGHYGIYFDLANRFNARSVRFDNLYFENNNYAVYVNDVYSSTTLTALFTGGLGASAAAPEKIYLGTYGKATIIGGVGWTSTGTIEVSSAASTAEVSIINCTNVVLGSNVTGKTTLSGSIALIPGTTGGINLNASEATGTPSGTTTYFDIAVAVPSGARLKGVQLRVDTALTAGETWGAAFITGSTTTIAAAGQAVAKNTKINLIIPDESTTGTTNIRITRDAGNFTDAAGVIRAIVYYESLTAMADAP